MANLSRSSLKNEQTYPTAHHTFGHTHTHAHRHAHTRTHTRTHTQQCGGPSGGRVQCAAPRRATLPLAKERTIQTRSGGYGWAEGGMGRGYGSMRQHGSSIWVEDEAIDWGYGSKCKTWVAAMGRTWFEAMARVYGPEGWVWGGYSHGLRLWVHS